MVEKKERCAATVYGAGVHTLGFQCKNRAKTEAGFCWVHDPTLRAERIKNREPSQQEWDCAAREKEMQERKLMRAVIKEARAVAFPNSSLHAAITSLDAQRGIPEEKYLPTRP